MTPYRNCSRLDGFHPSLSLKTSIWARTTIALWVVFLLLILGGCPGTTEQGGPAGTSNLAVDLENLQPSLGALSPSFDPTTDSYQVIVGPTTGQVLLTATVADPRASLRISGQPAASGQPFGPIAVQPGTNPPIPVVVEAFGLEKQYTVVIERTTTAQLQSLAASAGTLAPVFDPEKLAYTVTTETTTTSTTITATLVDPTATLTINNQSVVSGQPSPAIGLAFGPTPIPVRVQAQDGKSKDYVVTVIRPFPDCSTSLDSLTVSQGSLSPGFDPGTQNYSVGVGSGVGSLTVTAGAAMNAIVTINGQTTSTAQVSLNPGGQSTTITITVECPDGTAKIYTIRVDREAPCNSTLTNLTINQGQLSPGFNPNQTSYQVNVGDAEGQVTVTATPAAGSSVSINGQTTNTLAVNLNPAGQSTTITIVVQCPDGSTRTYTITVNRAAPCSTNLTTLTVFEKPIPGFNPNTTNYTVNVSSTTESVSVEATAGDNATVSINGQTTTSLNVNLNPPGQNTVIQVVVRCQDGNTKTYTITVVRQANADLSSLVVSSQGSVDCPSGLPLEMQPEFSPNTLDYNVKAGAFQSQVCVEVTTVDPNATVTINGQTTKKRSVTLNAAGTTTLITIIVTAADGTTTKTYTATVFRAAASNNNFLQSLSVSAASKLGLGFDKNMLAYNITTCCSAQSSTTVTAVPEDPSATMTISVNNGTPSILQSGVTFGPVMYPNGTTTIRINVRAQNGDTRTYTVTICHMLNTSSSCP